MTTCVQCTNPKLKGLHTCGKDTPEPHDTLSRADHLKNYNELVRERSFKLDTLKRSLEQSIDKGYDFAFPNANLFMMIIQLEAQIRELHYVLFGMSNGGGVSSTVQG